MAIYRYLFLLLIFVLLAVLAWLSVPEEAHKQEMATDILNIKKEDATALKQALEATDLQEVVESIPGRLRDEARIVVQSPSFLGADKAGYKWHVVAEKAYQERETPVLGLEVIEADRAPDQPEKNVKLNAPKGKFDDQKNVLFLDHGFDGMLHDIDVTGSRATYAMTEQQTEGEDLHAVGEDGQLAAKLFKADLIAETAEFNGGVHMVIKLKPKKDQQEPLKTETTPHE